MATVHLRGEDFVVSAPDVVRAVRHVEPGAIRDYYVVVRGRRFPPKQIVAQLTGLPAHAFGSEQARSFLRAIGFPVHRRDEVADERPGPYGGAEGDVLSAYAGRWVAQDGLRILFDADSPEAVVRWLRRNHSRAHVWRVPATPRQAGSATSTPC